MLAEQVGSLIAAVSFATFWASYRLWFGLYGKPETLSGTVLLTAGFGIYLGWLFFEMLARRREVRTQHLLILGLNGIFYFGCVYTLLKPQYGAGLGLLAVAVAGVHLLLGISLWKARAEPAYDSRPVLLAFGIAVGFLTLAVPIQFTGVSITVIWAFEAAVLAWIGCRANERLVSACAAAVYVLVFLRLYITDAWVPQSQLLINSRFVAFVVSALGFWLGAWCLKSTRVLAPIPYTAAHFILLSACLFELNDWVGTSVSGTNRASVLAVSVSILMALYGTLLISLGVIYRSALNRVLGLVLMGIVVLKLYFYDVWEASRLFRTAAFVSLGLLLLLTSYLYSRHRGAIENWWKRDEGG